ncbi:YHYH protein [bacterium]|jgi:hypothetical protein|nr:YHYH protein [bacterium]
MLNQIGKFDYFGRAYLIQKACQIILCGCLIVVAGCSTTDSDTESDSIINEVSITVSGDVRTITSNGIPDHGLDENTNYPNTLSEQTLVFTTDVTPTLSESVIAYDVPDKFGVAVNGIPFDPFTAEYWNNDKNSGWHIDATGGNLGLDVYGGHVQPDGTYHYHTVSDEFFTAFSINSFEHSPIVGWAADGYPVYAKYAYETATDNTSSIVEIRANYELKNSGGNRPSGSSSPGGTYDGTYIEDYEFVESLNGDLNEANARYGVTPDFPEGTWYYVLTDNFPYIPINFIGTSDSSFNGGPSNSMMSRYFFRHQEHSH